MIWAINAHATSPHTRAIHRPAFPANPFPVDVRLAVSAAGEGVGASITVFRRRKRAVPAVILPPFRVATWVDGSHPGTFGESRHPDCLGADSRLREYQKKK